MPLLEFTTRDGVMVYTRRGLGDPVVLVHGIYPGASHHEYDANIAAIQSRGTIYAVDLIGFGQSDAPRRAHSAQMHQHALRDFIEHQIGEPATVVASGLSAGVAARLGVYDDSWVRRVVLLGPVHKDVFHETPELGDRLSQFLLGTLAIGAGHYSNASSRDGLREFLAMSYHDKKAITREQIDELFVEANEPHKMMPYISALCGYFDTDLTNWLPYVRRPTQIIVGRDQLPLPTERWLKPTSWSQGKWLHVIDDTRDFPHQERPAAVNTLVLEFLEETQTPNAKTGTA